MNIPRIHCKTCQHYYVTWDRHFPHGCTAYEIKSSLLPSNIVYKSSGQPCMQMTPKTGKNDVPRS